MVELDQGGRLAGHASVKPVPGGLRSIAEHSFILRTDHEHGESWRIVPDVSPHLLVHFASGSSGPLPWRAGLSGARTVYCEAPVRLRSFSVGVRLAPGALPGLTGASATEFVDRSVRLSELWPRETDRLMNRITDDCTPEGAREALLIFLRELWDDAGLPDWRVRGYATLLRSEADVSLDRSVEALGMGSRTLRRTCIEHVGLGPKRMARITRIYRAIATSIRHPELLGSRSAVTAGFADQAHMIREFRALLGETPRQFATRRTAAEPDRTSSAGAGA